MKQLFANFAICSKSIILAKRSSQRSMRISKRNGIKISTGTIVDATIISAPSSTKNINKKRDPEMHQTKKGNEWHFGMKAHIGVDSRERIVHTIVATAANVHDSKVLPRLLHGKEKRATNRRKSGVRSYVEHIFGIMKGRFGFRKVRYRGIDKNFNKLNVLAALANMVICKKRLPHHC